MSTVEYLGETEDVRDFLKQAHAVVLPSYREGLSRSLLEAASMEKPIIASAVPGCKEVVKDQINGLLCKPGDPADLALKMKTLYTYSQEKLRKMGIAGRKLVKDQFTEVRVNSYYLDAIKEFA
jgi:glycosyltransferase involved in cell wall biosynthesis